MADHYNDQGRRSDKKSKPQGRGADAGSRMNSAARRRRRKRRSALLRPLVYLIMIAVMAAGISVFFKISHIEVKGNTRYTAEEIISASSLQQGDSLFFVNSFRITNQIFSALPYVDEATISK
jgi:cell division septal protein FtsQ